VAALFGSVPRHGVGLRAMLAGAALALLAGCGFHLRGQGDLPQNMGPVYLQVQAESALTRELRQSFDRRNIVLAGSAAQARTVLRITREDSGRRVLSVGSGGRAREYELYHVVEFDVRGPGEAVRLEHQALTAIRDYSFDETQVLGKAGEEAVLREDMNRELASRILRQLSLVSR
jgi:LPS-assembly lipoprotein